MTSRKTKFALLAMLLWPFLGQNSLAEEMKAVEIGRDECAMLAKQAARSSASYLPGMSTNGKSVVSATTGNNGRDYLPDSFIIPLSASLSGLLGLSDSQKSFLSDGVSVGTVSVSRGGTVSLNGHRIAGPSEAVELWQALCQQ